MWGLLKTCGSVLSRRFVLLILLNWLFFGSMVAGAFLGNFELGAVVDPYSQNILNANYDSPLLFLEIFLFNFFVSGFIMVTLSGCFFFALPVVVLSFRALLWGALLNGLSTGLLFVAFLVLILEGESYVLMALAGVGLGLSWLKPQWMYKGEALGRREAFRRTLRESMYIYVLVTILLFIGAVLEAVTVLTIK